MDSQSLTESIPADNRNRWYSSNIDSDKPPEIPRTVRALHNEHIYISNLLDSLEEQFSLIEEGREVDFNFMIDIVDYMKDFPNRFHHPKEDLIFQRMALRDEGSLHEVQVVIEEHRNLEALIVRVGEAIDDYHLLPTVQKRKRVGELCREYVALMRQHMNREEAVLLPRSIEVLREEDWFLIEQQSTPLQELAIEDELADNYSAMRRRVRAVTEQLANTLVLAEFLNNHAMLEIAGGMGASISHGRRAYRRGVKRGWRAYVVACKSWFPQLGDKSQRTERFKSPVQESWQMFMEGLRERAGPRDVEMTMPVVRSLKLYAGLMGGFSKTAGTQELPRPGT